MSPLLESLFSAEFGYAIVRVMTPLLFPAIGVAFTALAGTINIALEGIMLVAAFTGVAVSVLTGSYWISLLAGIGSGILMGSILAYFHLRLKANIILAAVALNLFAGGITIFLSFLITGDKGSTSALNSLVFPEIDIPLIETIPILGTILSGHNVLTYVAIISVFIFYLIVFRTPLGLRIRAVGQNSDAAESVGVNVNRIRWYALMLSGVFGALGGLYLSMGYVSWFSRDMTAGRGFIAIAASTLGGNLPLGTFLASLLFGFVNAVAIYIATIDVPSELIQLIPYAVTIIALAVYSYRANRTKGKGDGRLPQPDEEIPKPKAGGI
ncbi:MAG: ABC transporter permease [Alkalispirochaetaceae bacterium]